VQPPVTLDAENELRVRERAALNRAVASKSPFGRAYWRWQASRYRKQARDRANERQPNRRW
jgi:hypothetical protein